MEFCTSRNQQNPNWASHGSKTLDVRDKNAVVYNHEVKSMRSLIYKIIELDTQLNEEFKLMRKNIHNFKNKKCWAKIKKTHIRKISK